MPKIPSIRARFQWVRLCALGTLFGLAAVFSLFESIETWTEDWRYRHFNRAKRASDRVVFIDIDEQSLAFVEDSGRYGRWPWRRRAYLDLAQGLAAAEPSGIFFDILFDAPQLVSDSELVRRIEPFASKSLKKEIEAHLDENDDDAQLAMLSEAIGKVSHAALFTMTGWREGERQVPMPKDFSEKFSVPFDGKIETPKYESFQIPTKKILDRSHSVHVVNFEQGEDPVYRYAPMIFRYGDAWYPSLTLRALLWEAGEGKVRLEKGQLHIEGTRRSFAVPIDEYGRYRFHFYTHKPNSLPMSAALSAARRLLEGDSESSKVLQDVEVHPEEFENKIIIIGASAVGLEDLKVTPVENDYPGPLLHATAISNILEGDYLRRLSPLWHWIIGLSFLVLLYFTKGESLKLLAPAILFAGYVGSSLYGFQNWNLSLPLAIPGALFAWATLDLLVTKVIVERAKRKRIEGTLSKYLSPEVTRQLIERGEDPQSEIGKKEELTVMFSDIRGFTTLAEKSTPEAIVGHLNSYLSAMTQIIFDHRGTLDKFIGDAILSFWGAPLKDSNHAQSAVRCGLKMQEYMASIPERLRRGETSLPPFEIGIGIATGRMIVGNIGGEKHLSYTVIGDTVNLASRIEGLHKEYHVPVLIDEGTYHAVRDEILCRFLDEVQVAGRSGTTKLFEAIAPLDSIQGQQKKTLVSKYEAALELYRSGNFGAAAVRFREIVQLHRDPVSRLMEKRSLEYNKETQIDWKGVYVARQK